VEREKSIDCVENYSNRRDSIERREGAGALIISCPDRWRGQGEAVGLIQTGQIVREATGATSLTQRPPWQRTCAGRWLSHAEILRYRSNLSRISSIHIAIAASYSSSLTKVNVLRYLGVGLHILRCDCFFSYSAGGSVSNASAVTQSSFTGNKFRARKPRVLGYSLAFATVRSL
jgi:hypothetical protein